MCVEESMHGEILQVEEWKCMYAPKPKVMQTCNLFDCPKWIAMDWSQVGVGDNVTCNEVLDCKRVLRITKDCDTSGRNICGAESVRKLSLPCAQLLFEYSA